LAGFALIIVGRFSSDHRGDEAVKFFETERAEWNVCIQLCTDLNKMPVEDASIEWPEALSPYVAVARIVARRKMPTARSVAFI
jgi:hypothetical protein